MKKVVVTDDSGRDKTHDADNHRIDEYQNLVLFKGDEVVSAYAYHAWDSFEYIDAEEGK